MTDTATHSTTHSTTRDASHAAGCPFPHHGGVPARKAVLPNEPLTPTFEVHEGRWTLRSFALVRAVLPALGARRGPCPAGCDRALDHALITAPDHRDPALLSRLDAVAGRVLGAP